MSGLRGVAYVAEVPGMRRRCRGREAERPGPLTEAPGGGPGGRRIPASEEKQKAVFVRKPLLSYDRMRYSLSGVTLT